MAKPPSFQFYAQDFLTGVMYLTNEEKGIYITMLAKQWTDERIPKKRLGFLVGIEWDSFSEELKSKFTDHGDYLVNNRLEEERIKKVKFIEKQGKNGSLGGRPKKKHKAETPVNPGEETQIKPKPFKNQKPKESQKNPLEEEKEDEYEIEKGIKKKEIDLDKIVSIFNSVCNKLPQVQKLTDKRKSAMKARIEEYELSEIGTAFQNVAKSSFLNGDNDRGWTADFDWIMNPNNFIKIIEGKYNNNGKSNTKSNEEVFAGAMASETGRNFKFK